MRKIITKEIVMATTLAMTIFAFILTACSSNPNGFSIDARYLNMNMADFYVYSPDGAITGIDTLHVKGGRFTYERELNHAGTIVIVYPNFALLPVFVDKGSSISIDGNAANLKETKVKGTKDNEVFTEWRLNTNQLSPPEMKKHAEQFIHEHPDAAAARWLLQQYFLLAQKPDYAKAKALISEILKATKNEAQAVKLSAAISGINQLNVGDQLPDFSARDIDGTMVSGASMRSGSAVILLWSSWNYESQNALRQMANDRRKPSDERKVDNVLTICLDADVKECRATLSRNNATNLPTICDGLMFETPLLKILGINGVPDNLKIVNGKVTLHAVPANKLTE